MNKCKEIWWRRFLKLLVRDKRLTPLERISSRMGYMGTGFLIAGQWSLEPILFVIGFLCVMFQVAVRKQWNLVILHVNGLTAWLIHLFRGL